MIIASIIVLLLVLSTICAAMYACREVFWGANPCGDPPLDYFWGSFKEAWIAVLKFFGWLVVIGLLIWWIA